LNSLAYTACRAVACYNARSMYSLFVHLEF